MGRRVALWITASAVGGALLAAPDEGRRIVDFSDAHGLTLLDAVAVGLLFVGWLPAAVAIWHRRDDLLRSVGQSTASGGFFVAGLGLGLVIASAFADFAAWWAVGAVLLAAIQLAALLAASRP